MKTTVKFSGLIILVAALVLCGCGKKRFTSWKYIKNQDAAAQLKSFVAEKKAQADSDPDAAPAEFAPFFAAAKSGDWLAVSNAFNDFRNHAPQYQHSGADDPHLHGIQWADVLEIWGAFYAFSQGDQKYTATYANDIIESIPPGSIYFGGSDAGRFLITAMQKSQVNGIPFFTLTQNALADGGYLDYLRSMYGDKIYIPTSEDSQKCFDDYSADAKARLQNHQLKRGENVKMSPDGKPQISGMVAVMAINGLLARTIFDKNPNQDFYLQQSFPLDWMYPYLEPHGLIFKIDHEAPAELSDETLQSDDDYWTKVVSPMIGHWLTRDTQIADIVAFDRKVFYQHNFDGFTGDPDFIKNTYASVAFACDRANIAGLYVWRMNHTTNSDERERMAREADFAFRQSLALYPGVSQTVRDYQSFLRSQDRDADAQLLNRLGAAPRR